MRLRTYRRHPRPGLVALDWVEHDPPTEFTPGQYVKTPQHGGCGLTVAVTDEEVSILWSQLPNTPRDLQSFIEVGYVFVPKIPLQVTPTIFSPDDFKPKRGLMTRYGAKKIRPDYYGTVSVLGIASGSI